MKSNNNNNIGITEVVLILPVFALPLSFLSISNIPNVFQENTKNKLFITDLSKLGYSTGEDLFFGFVTLDVNDYVYTILEDDLLEEVYYALYNADEKMILPEMNWYIYDLALNNQFCMYNKFDEYCYVSEDEIKTEVSSKREDDGYRNFYNTAQIESSVHGTITYETRASAEFQQVVAYAYIIVQGPDTPGYEEALQSSYDIAERNGSYRLDYFMEYYPSDLSYYAEEIEELNNMSVAEIIDNYDEYKEIIAEIEYYMEIM